MAKKQSLAMAMRQQAEDAVTMVEAEFGRRLDFSEPSIGAVEAILNGFWTEGDHSHELIVNIAQLFGAYIGEVVRGVLPDADWVPAASDSKGPNVPHIQWADIEIFPMTWCYKRVHNGPSDSIVQKYLAFRQAVDERL